MLRFAILPACALLCACLPDVRAFTCDTDAECGDGRRCLGDEHACAEPASACESGWRYVDLAGAGECTAPPEPPPPPPPPPFTRDVCLVGPAMPAGRDACVDLVCAADASCCTLGWSERCVQGAASTCAPSAGESRCPADITLHASGGSDVLRLRPSPTSPGTLACIDGFPGTPADTITWTTQAAWADADADGNADLAMVAKGGLRIFESRGVGAGGILDLGGPVVTLTEPWGMADSSEVWGSRADWGDADQDGDLDLAWHDAVGGLRVLVRDAAAPSRYVATTLVAPEEMPEVVQAVGVAWMQLDEDRDLELVATLAESFVLFDRQGDGSWSRTTSVAAPAGGFAATFDRLVTSSGHVFFAGTHGLNGGSYIGSWGRGVALGDLDRNGFLDVVIGNWDGVFLHAGGASGFAAPEKISVLAKADVYGVGIGDFDGDGALDVYGAAHQNADSLMLQRAGGGFDTPAMAHLDRPGVSIVSLGAAAPFDTGLCSQ